MEEVVMALKTREDVFSSVKTNIVTEQIYPSSQLLSQITGIAVPINKPVVGANAFAHEAGIHQDGMLKDASTYQIIDPDEIGLTMTLPLGKHSGRHAFSRACEEAGIVLARAQLNDAFERFKALADSRRHVSLSD